MSISASGDFWLPDSPAAIVRGAFNAEPGTQPEVRPAGTLIEDPRVTRSPTGIVYARGSAGGVRAFQPITMQGRLDSGEFVTLIKAQNGGGPGSPFEAPHYQAHYAIVGDRNVSGPDQFFSEMRFRFGDPYWLGHLHEGETSPVGGDGSTIHVEAAEDGNWLHHTSPTPMTLERLEATVVMGCLTLTELALDQLFDARDTQVRIDDGDAWLTVHGPGANTPPNEFEYATLVPREELTLDRFAKWIPINDTLDGLGRVVAQPLDGYLQTQALLVTTLLEGLHRRLKNFPQSKFAPTSNRALESIKKAVRRLAREMAAADENLDPQKVHEAVMNSVGHFEEVDYIQRATDVVARVSAAIPEVTESVPAAELARHLKIARNEMAHQTLPDEKKEPLDQRILRWLVITSTTPWLLRSLLLLEAGIEPGVLHLGYLGNSRFLCFRENVAQFVRELGWNLPTG
jgi:hypothetical protein